MIGLTIIFAIKGALLPETAFHILLASPVLGIACMAIEIDNHTSKPSIELIVSKSISPEFDELITTGSANNAPINEFKKKGPAAIKTS